MQMTSGLTSSATPEWATPQWLFDLLNEEFRFTLDVCATDGNAKCADYYTEQDDGLSQEWYGTVWCNPPYGRAIGAWVRKCAESNPGGGVNVALLPARTETKWCQQWVFPYATEVRFISGRLKFNDGAVGAPFPSMLAIYDKREKPWVTATIGKGGSQ